MANENIRDPGAGFKVKMKNTGIYLCKNGNPLGVTCTWSDSATAERVEFTSMWQLASGSFMALDVSTGSQKKIHVLASAADQGWQDLDGNKLPYLDGTIMRYLGPNDGMGQVCLVDESQAVEVETDRGPFT